MRAGVVNPYIIPIRVRLQGLRRALDEAQSDCWPIPDDADLRLFLELEPLRETDSASAILQKAAENQRIISRKLQLHGYNIQYEPLLTALLDVFDGEAAHALDESRAADRDACAEALKAIAEGVAGIRAKYTRP